LGAAAAARYNMNPQDLVARGLTPELAVFLTSMLPVIELRGALPLAINVFNIAWPKAFLIAYIGNMIPAPLILWLLAPVVKLLSKIRIFERFFSWLFDRTRRRSNRTWSSVNGLFRTWLLTQMIKMESI
jgi:hypothetical protein